MRMMNKQAAAVVVAVLAAGAAMGLGPIDPPPGPITSTGKTLTEVEPRIAINPVNTPGDADSVYKITQPGSYYLTGNLTGVSGKHGIEIAARDVRLDLCGFTLAGAAGSLNGIHAENAGHRAAAVKNGTVSSWGGYGVNLIMVRGSSVSDVTAVANGSIGIAVASNSRLTNCVSRQNPVGIVAESGCVLTGCASYDDDSTGIVANTGSVVQNCSVFNAGQVGIYADIGCTVIGCTVRACGGMGIRVDDGALVTQCSVTSNGHHGIYSPRSAMVIDCNSSFNAGDGVRVKDRSIVRGNTLSTNGLNGDGAGVAIFGTDCLVEGNNCTGADRGVDVGFAGNFISRNRCSGNTVNYLIVAGNVCLVINAATAGNISGSSGGTAPGSTDPNANFSF